MLNRKFEHFYPPNLISNFFRKFEKLKQGLAKCSTEVKVFVFNSATAHTLKPLGAIINRTSLQNLNSYKKMDVKKTLAEIEILENNCLSHI